MKQSMPVPSKGDIVTLVGIKDDHRLYVIIGCKTRPHYTLVPIIGGEPMVVLLTDFKICDMNLLLRRYEGISNRSRTVSYVHNKQYRAKRRERYMVSMVKAISRQSNPAKY